MRKKVLIVLVFGIFLFTAAAADENYLPNSGHLKGFIYKKDGETPRWGAQVVLQDVENKLVFRSNVTDDTGDYELINVPVGDYKVMIVAMEKPYKVKNIDFLINILDNKTSFISFSLKKSIKGLFFLLEPCCLATIISGTAAGVTVGKLIPPKEQKEVSPTQK
ncbi:MAG: carboxypeptidase regulatory-like domain-containing protein [Candidatus Aminicenantes bacterium]|nr:carboxypeptidase regulatory-like domain-containing protein [Candidatus Aminicenantes bacterium]